MTVDEASVILHEEINAHHALYSLDQLRALCIATSVLDAQTEAQKAMIDQIWDCGGKKFSLLVGKQ